MTGLLLELWELHSINGLDTISERLSDKPLSLKQKKKELQTHQSEIKLLGKLGKTKQFNLIGLSNLNWVKLMCTDDSKIIKQASKICFYSFVPS